MVPLTRIQFSFGGRTSRCFLCCPLISCSFSTCSSNQARAASIVEWVALPRLVSPHPCCVGPMRAPDSTLVIQSL
jgi:hypothetical protein